MSFNPYEIKKGLIIPKPDILIKHADNINRVADGGDIINVENGEVKRKHATFNMNMMKGAENELWADYAYEVVELGFDTPVLNVIDTVLNDDGSDALHIPTVGTDTVTTTLEGNTPNNSDNATTPSVVDMNTKNQTNSRFSFTTKQLASMSFDLMSKKMAIQTKAILKDIQTQVLIIMNEGAASAHRQERATGDAMTKTLLETAWQYIMDDGADPMNIFCVHDPATMVKISNIAETTSAHLMFSRYDYSQSEWLKKGIIGEILGMKNIVTILPTEDDDWSGREAGVYCATYFDANGVACGINKRPRILSLNVLTNPGVQYNIQYFWGAAVVNSNLIAPIKMCEA